MKLSWSCVSTSQSFHTSPTSVCYFELGPLWLWGLLEQRCQSPYQTQFMGSKIVQCCVRPKVRFFVVASYTSFLRLWNYGDMRIHFVEEALFFFKSEMSSFIVFCFLQVAFSLFFIFFTYGKHNFSIRVCIWWFQDIMC